MSQSPDPKISVPWVLSQQYQPQMSSIEPSIRPPRPPSNGVPRTLSAQRRELLSAQQSLNDERYQLHKAAEETHRLRAQYEEAMRRMQGVDSFVRTWQQIEKDRANLHRSDHALVEERLRKLKSVRKAIEEERQIVADARNELRRERTELQTLRNQLRRDRSASEDVRAAEQQYQRDSVTRAQLSQMVSSPAAKPVYVSRAEAFAPNSPPSYVLYPHPPPPRTPQMVAASYVPAAAAAAGSVTRSIAEPNYAMADPATTSIMRTYEKYRGVVLPHRMWWPFANVQITLGQLMRWKEVFERLDRARTGSLGFEEVGQWAVANGRRNITAAEINSMIRMIDVNFDRRIDWWEFLAVQVFLNEQLWRQFYLDEWMVFATQSLRPFLQSSRTAATSPISAPPTLQQPTQPYIDQSSIAVAYPPAPPAPAPTARYQYYVPAPPSQVNASQQAQFYPGARPNVVSVNDDSQAGVVNLLGGMAVSGGTRPPVILPQIGR